MPRDTESDITPYAVASDVDYRQFLDRFGAAELSDEQAARFPDPVHPMVRRRVFYAERDVDPFLDAMAVGKRCSVVTGRGPSGPMHIGHIPVFYFARYLQERAGVDVYVPLSDDEKYWSRDLSLTDVSRYTRQNLLDLLAVGFDPTRTRFVVDTADADVVYPVATAFAKDVTISTVEATYGAPENAGMAFYPAVQIAHLLLPQLVHGPQPTLVPIAVDQDPHVRVARDIAAKRRYPVEKPGALLSTFLPQLGGGTKMSTSDEAPTIALTNDRETVHETIARYAYSGGRDSVEEHRERGGDPTVDVAYLYLAYFFEPVDDTVSRLARQYREGELLTGDLKAYAADMIADFLEAHQRRRERLGPLEDELPPFRLTPDEREQARHAVGLEGL